METPAHLLESITDEDTFDYNGLGGILGIPQDLMVSLASVLSSSVLLLGKSPKLVIILYCITQLQSLASNQLGLGINHLTTMIGFDKPLRSNAETDGASEWDVDQVLVRHS